MKHASPSDVRGLNVGSGPDWFRDGWSTTDHRARRTSTAWRIDSNDESFDFVFTSHMIEHIPHYKIDEVLSECNRVLRPNGAIRIVCPNLEAFALAYVRQDWALFQRFAEEDPTIRQDLGLGGMLMNFIVSPGADNLLLSRNGECIGGYAHLYSYDFAMLETLLARHGFRDIRRRGFCESDFEEFREPLHPIGAPATWSNVREWTARDKGITGFDRNPLTSLFIEARKERRLSCAPTRFGVPGERGLDAANFSWINVSRAYLHFSFAKLRSTFHRMFHRLPERILESLRALASTALPPRVKRVIKRLLRSDGRG